MLARGDDRPNIINLTLRTELKAKAEAPRDVSDLNPRGCRDASLYRRFQQLGLSQVKMFPQLATNTDRTRLRVTQQNQILPALTTEEAEEWRVAVAEAEAEGTFFIAEAFHCAVGTKPEEPKASEGTRRQQIKEHNERREGILVL